MEILKHTSLKELRKTDEAREALKAMRKDETKRKSVKASDLLARIEQIEQLLGIE